MIIIGFLRKDVQYQYFKILSLKQYYLAYWKPESIRFKFIFFQFQIFKFSFLLRHYSHHLPILLLVQVVTEFCVFFLSSLFLWLIFQVDQSF